MQIIQKLKNGEFQKHQEVTFLIWLILLPFGAKIGAVSLGYFTVYPGLIFSFLLFPVAFFSFRKWGIKERGYLLLLLIWLLYAISWGIWNSVNSEWKFDVHSLLLQLLYGTIIIGVFHQFGTESFLRLLRKGAFFYLMILYVFGMIEFFSGLHFAGETTRKLINRELIDDVFYMPTFIYDNPNDFIVYLSGLSFILILIQPIVNHWKNLSILIALFLFTVIADARFGIFLSGVLIAIQVFIIIKSAWKFDKVNYVVIGLGLILSTILIYRSPIFIGPRFNSTPKIESASRSGGIIVSKNSNDSSDALSSNDSSEALPSNQVRKNLIINGFEYIKERPLSGIGPGQFRYRHAHNQKLEPTGTIVGPHNFPIEVLAQYGLIGLLFFFFLIFVFIKQIQKFRRDKNQIWLLMSLPVFGIISLIPSSFLYMDINWLLIPVIVLLTFDNQKKSGIPAEL